MQTEQLLEDVEQEEGAQGWLATFADLMSLLMCFFVLLLSFSELDVQKFKQIAGSMKYAFGVQNKINVQDIPKGTSVIAQEFRPGKPDDSPINRIEQITFEQQHSFTEDIAPAKSKVKQNSDDLNGQKKSEPGALLKKVSSALKDQINAGQFELDNQGQQLVIRIKEHGSFASGSGFLQPRLKPVLHKLGNVLVDIPGQLVVSGHTDSRTLNNELFQDNLELSAARAIAVARVLNYNGHLNNLIVRGMAASQPLVPNDSPENMRQNRRVEITVSQGKAKESEFLPLLPE